MAAPYGKHNFRFFHKIRIPWTQLKGRNKKRYYYAVLLLRPLLKAFNFVMPKQSNNFAAVVLKPQYPRDLHPWLLWEDKTPKLNVSWLAERYSRKS